MKKFGSMLNKTKNQAKMQEDFANRFIFKEGHGTARNACYWKVCYDKQLGIYTAQVSFGGAGGSSTSLYQINGDIFNQVGNFEDDDYKSERLIKTGRRLIDFDSSKYAPDGTRLFDRDWKSICPWFE
ncbi:MAG: hypothetical protein J6P73_08190 [Bacteroidales bacterium]|nr:hypothetical protein [Bacteroidales bacterium]